MRPDKYLRQAAVIRRHGTNAMTGISLSAARSPEGDRAGRRARLADLGASSTGAVDAAAVALQRALGGPRGHARDPVPQPPRSGRVARRRDPDRRRRAAAQHRLLRRRSCATCWSASSASVVVYDEEFAPLLAEARERVRRPGRGAGLAGRPGRTPGRHTLDELIEQHLGQQPDAAAAPGRTVLLTSGTTGTPKGARRSGRRRRLARRDARADPVAGRGDDRGRRADVPRLGLRPARDLGDDVLHRRDAPPVRPRGHARAGRPSTRRPASPSYR